MIKIKGFHFQSDNVEEFLVKKYIINYSKSTFNNYKSRLDLVLG
jgi:hypothetical protein